MHLSMANSQPNWFQRRLLDAAIWLTAGYVEFVYRSGRYEHLGEEHPGAYWQKDEPFIGAVWHNRLVLIIKSWRHGSKVTTLVSRHSDGAFIAGVFSRMGYEAVRGSSLAQHKKKKDRGGAAAFREMIRILRDGKCMGLTPDGPKGPRYRVKSGIILLARQTGLPIIPAAYSAKWAIRIGSWDKLIFPLPFSPGVYLWGKPIHVPKDADASLVEEKRMELERELQRVTDECDQMMGHNPIAPGEPLNEAPQEEAGGGDVQQIA